MAPRFILSDAHMAKFERDGFLHIPREEHGLVAEPGDLSQWVSEILSWPREKGKWMPYDEVNQRGEKQLMRTENVAAHFPPISELLLGEGVLSMLKQLSGKVRHPPHHHLVLFLFFFSVNERASERTERHMH